MMIKEIPYNKDFERSLLKQGKILGVEYAKKGHPKTGIAYWRYAAVKLNGLLYIIEWIATQSDTQTKINIVDY